jgi:RNA polymerase sigma-70 factor, ECF subfamily
MAESGEDDGELFTALYPALRRFAGAIRPAGADADDLVQEALARTLAVRALASIENPAAYLRTAMVRIASNGARGDRRRSRRQREDANPEEVADVYPSDLDDLMRVSSKARAVLFLTVVEDCSYAEAAEVVGGTEAAVRGECRDATERDDVSELQSLLEQLADDGEPRGAQLVFVSATQRATGHRRTRRRRRAFSACAAVLAIVVGVAAIAHLTATSNSAPDIRTVPSTVAPTTDGVTAAQFVAGHWGTIPAAPLQLRSAVTAWTGNELFVWGGLQLPETSQSPFRSGGALYNPATHTWREVRSFLDAGDGDVAVWTGHEVLLWNGPTETSGPSAAAYNPATNRWRRLPAVPSLPLGTNAGVWTGDRAVFFSGVASEAYDPVANAWVRLPAPTPPPSASLLFVTAAGPGRILAWSVRNQVVTTVPQGTPAVSVAPNVGQNVGATDLFRYDEATNRWTALAKSAEAISMPEEAVWTGTGLLVRGDMHAPFAIGPGPLPEVTAWYNPDTGVARRIPADALTADDTPASGFSSVWTGRALLSLNAQGQTGDIQPGDASVYEPTSGAWRRLPRAPFGCSGATLTWTGAVVVTYCLVPYPTQPRAVGGLVFVPGPAGPGDGPASISGTLHSAGGPAPGVGTPLPGTVTATDTNGATFDAVAGADGKFSLSVPAGAYTLTGTSPRYESGAGKCQGGVFLVNGGSATSGVTVACQER